VRIDEAAQSPAPAPKAPPAATPKPAGNGK
jgi:hypothetical protein